MFSDCENLHKRSSRHPAPLRELEVGHSFRCAVFSRFFELNQRPSIAIDVFHVPATCVRYLRIVFIR